MLIWGSKLARREPLAITLIVVAAGLSGAHVMKRWHEETAHMDRQLAIVERWIIWHKKRGYYRKRKALDCGQARCFGCHSDKYPKREKTRKEQEADLNFREEIAEYNESRENPGSR